MNCECCKERETEFYICADCIEAFPWHYHDVDIAQDCQAEEGGL